MLRDSPGVVQNELERQAALQKGVCASFLFLKRKSFGQRTRMKRGTLRGKGAGPRPLRRAAWLPVVHRSQSQREGILTDRKNKGATAAAPLSAGITVSAARLPRRDLWQSGEISCELQAVRVNRLQRLGAAPDADLRNCCPRAGGQGTGLCHRIFEEEARRLESQLAFSWVSRTAILGVST